MSNPSAYDDIFNEMLEWSDKSGTSEMQAVHELIENCLVNEKHDKDELDSDSVILLDAILAEVVEAANAAREQLAKLRKETGA